MGEKESNGKNSRLGFSYCQKVILGYSAVGAYILTPAKQDYKKKTKSKAITRVKMGRNKKCNKKKSKSNKSQESEQWPVG